jgi:hypothetical protein
MISPHLFTRRTTALQTHLARAVLFAMDDIPLERNSRIENRQAGEEAEPPSLDNLVGSSIVVTYRRRIPRRAGLLFSQTIGG